MTDGDRSPFGELVYRYRQGLSLSQRDLALRANELTSENPDAATLSERTIASIESRVTPSSRPRRPRLSTVRTLATVFGLEPGTPEYEAFVQAARGEIASRTHVPDPQSTIMSGFVAAGREPHLQRLGDAVDAAVAGTSVGVLVSADPGTGKTWLIEEACRDALERHSELVVLWGNCTEQPATAESHQSFRQILRMMVGDLGTFGSRQRVTLTNESNIPSRVPAAVHALVSDGHGLIGKVLSDTTLWDDRLAGLLDPEQRRVVSSLLQGNVPPEQPGMSMCEQFFRVLARYSETGPVILVLDDLHWADRGTCESLLHLLRHLREQQLPVLVLGAYRPGDLALPGSDDRHPLLPVLHEMPRHFRDPVLDLSTAVGGPAGRAFVDAMVDQFLGTAPPEMVDYLNEKTAGLALFLSSALSRLKERDDISHLVPEDRSASIQALLQTLPSDIEAAFSQQLSTLTEPMSTLLRVASVQGNSFSAEVVMRITEMTDADWFEHVDQELHQKRRLVFPGGVSHIGEQHSHEYYFWHAMMRDYLYDGMTEIQRAHYHRATADALIALHGERGHPATDTIAFHFEKAGEHRRAARAWIHAGDWAAYWNRSYSVAQVHFRRATELVRQTEAPEVYAQALNGLANCARGLARPEDAHMYVDRALAVAQRRNLPNVVANALAVKGMVEFDAGEMESGARHQSEAIEYYLLAGRQDEAGLSMANLSYLLHGMGRYDDAMAFANQGLDLARSIGDDSILVDATIALANCWLELGLYDDAIAAYEQCRVVCDDLGDMHRDSVCLLNIALCCFETAQWERGATAVSMVMEPERSTAVRLVGAAEFNMGLIAEGRGDPLADVRGHYERSRRIREDTGQLALLIDSLAGLMRVALGTGDLQEAETLLNRVDPYLSERGTDGIEHYGRLFVTLVETCRALGRDSEARTYLDQGIALLNFRSDGLQDPAHRESYLINVPSHRRLRELVSESDK